MLDKTLKWAKAFDITTISAIIFIHCCKAYITIHKPTHRRYIGLEQLAMFHDLFFRHNEGLIENRPESIMDHFREIYKQKRCHFPYLNVSDRPHRYDKDLY